MSQQYSNRIKALRKSKNMTQLRLSIELEISQEAVSSYENGKYYPSCDSLLKMSQIFNASIDYILGLSDSMLVDTSTNPDEEKFLSSLRMLDSRKKELLYAYLQGLSES